LFTKQVEKSLIEGGSYKEMVWVLSIAEYCLCPQSLSPTCHPSPAINRKVYWGPFDTLYSFQLLLSLRNAAVFISGSIWNGKLIMWILTASGRVGDMCDVCKATATTNGWWLWHTMCCQVAVAVVVAAAAAAAVVVVVARSSSIGTCRV